MTVPTAVANLFKEISTTKTELADEFSKVVEVPEQGVAQQVRVRTVLLADEKGRVQVVIPESSVLDLDSLNKQTNRELRALAKMDLEALKQRIQWQEIPVVPDLTGADVITDVSISDLEDIYTPSASRGNYLKMNRPLLEALIGQAKTMEVSVPLSDIAVNRDEPGQDIKQIHKAISHFTKFRICKRLEDTLEMPPLPESAQRIIKLRVDPNAGIADLADLVETDPSLSAQVVSWASSSFYAAPGKIRSVHDAIVRVLGFDLVMNLAMGLALGKTLDVPDDVPEGVASYWEQAVWMATLCGGLATAIPKDNRPEFGLTYLSGLLHNFGYLVLAHVFPPHFSLINRYTEVNGHVDVDYCEQHLLGITREQIGSQLMYTWNMPEEVVNALRQQKNPEYDGEHAIYANLIFVSTQFLRERNIAHGPAQAITQEIWDRLQLTEAGAREIFEELMGMADEMKMLAGNLEEAVS